MFDVALKTKESIKLKKVRLDFEDTRDFITSYTCPVVFCGVDPYFVEELQVAPSDFKEPTDTEPFFVEDKDSILKISVTVDEDNLKVLLAYYRHNIF